MTFVGVSLLSLVGEPGSVQYEELCSKVDNFCTTMLALMKEDMDGPTPQENLQLIRSGSLSNFIPISISQVG